MEMQCRAEDCHVDDSVYFAIGFCAGKMMNAIVKDAKSRAFPPMQLDASIA